MRSPVQHGSRHKGQLLTADELSIERTRGLGRVFSTSNTVLTGRNIRVEVVNDGPAPAWSDDNTVTFNLKQIGVVHTVDDVVAVTGLNYHELGHLLYTPSVKSGFGSRLRAMGLWQAFNVLEDQRIESILAAKYPATRPYFSTIFMKWILAHPDRSRTYALAYGRRFLPLQVREALKQDFFAQSKLQRLQEIIDEYRTVAFPRDDHKAFDLVQEFNNLLRVLPEDPYGHDHAGDEDTHTGGSSNPDQDEQDDATKEVAEQDERDDEDDDGDFGNGKSDDDDDADDIEDIEDDSDDTDNGAGDDDEDADVDGDGGDGDSDADGDEGSSEGTTSDGEGGQDSQPGDGGKSDDDSSSDGEGSDLDNDTDDGRSLDEIIEDELDDILSDPGLQNEAGATKRQIDAGDKKGAEQLDSEDFRTVQPTPEARTAARKLGKAFERLATDIDPGWNRQRPTGRLNVQRAIRGEEMDTWFDQWEEGNSLALDIEAAILVDRSASMRARMMSACMSAWAVKYGLEQVGASVSVVAYDDREGYLYKRNEKAKGNEVRSIASRGDTLPGDALHEAKRLFHYSKKHVKVLFAVTDGDWHDRPVSDAMVADLRRAGVIVVVVYLTSAGTLDFYRNNGMYNTLEENNGHGADVFEVLEDMMRLPDVAKKIITAHARNNKVR